MGSLQEEKCKLKKIYIYNENYWSGSCLEAQFLLGDSSKRAVLAQWSDSLSFCSLCSASTINVYLTCLDNNHSLFTKLFYSSYCSRWRTHYRAHSKPSCATTTSSCVSSMHLCSRAPHCPFDGRWRSPRGWSSWYWQRLNFKGFLLKGGRTCQHFEQWFTFVRCPN